MSQVLDQDPLSEPESQVLELLSQDFGYRFHDVKAAWLRQRIREHIAGERLRTVKGLREKLFHDVACRERLLRRLTRSMHRMFDDPQFFSAFRAELIPLLRTYPFLRIWHIDSSAPEQIFMLAVLLHEVGLGERSRIYTTDVSEEGLAQGQSGAISLVQMADLEVQYRLAGGRRRLSEYFAVEEDQGILKRSLRRTLIFAQHDLTTDGVFNEFHVIVCRETLPLLDPEGKASALALIRGSLVRLGFLCLAPHESAPETSSGMRFRAFGPPGTYRRMA